MNWPQLLCPDRLRKTTKQPEEKRSEIQRDYGRVAFSTPVRRLQDKAQVFPLETIDAVRTRLTHSMEVSSVARGVAHSVATKLAQKQIITAEQAYDIETIAATVGLIHDIGNPPFGHAGELAIQDWFKKKPEDFWAFAKPRFRTDLENFEGNAQTLRLLTKLQILSDRHGLNLTYATLSAATKYTASAEEIGSGNGRQSKRKLGFFSSEEPIIIDVREKTGTKDARNPITFLVEASDDMVYSVVDVEDGIKKGAVSWAEVKEVLSEHREEVGEEMFKDCVEGAESYIGRSSLKPQGRTRDEYISQYFRTVAIGKAADAVEIAFFANYDAIMEGTYDKELLYDSGAKGLYEVLKKHVNFPRIYNTKETLRLEVLGRNVIQSLLDIFWQAEPGTRTKTFPQKIYHLLSQNYRTVFQNPTEEEKLLPVEYRRALLVTDYICGMTDSFALNLHQELQHG